MGKMRCYKGSNRLKLIEPGACFPDGVFEEDLRSIGEAAGARVVRKMQKYFARYLGGELKDSCF